MKQVTIYVDGGCDPNPGAGAFAAVLEYGSVRKEFTDGEAASTNNRAEIQAAILGLTMLKEPCEVRVISDSRYLVETMSGKFSKNTNLDLWEKLTALSSRHTIEWVWVKGHAGNVGNERCHTLVQTRLGAAHRARLSDDDWITQTMADHQKRREAEMKRREEASE